MRRAMILGAGYGSRLRPLTDERPKPLVPIGDRPLLAHVADRLLEAGAEELVLNTHYQSEEFASYFSWIHAKVHVLHEVEILGTAGGIAGARALFGEGPAVVVNGDILCRAPFGKLRSAASDGLTLVVASRPAGRGTVGLDETGAVVRLRGRVFGREAAGADYVGVAALGERCLATLPARGCLVGDWALPELARGGRIGSVSLEGDWLDVGSLKAYLAANLVWLDELASPQRGWFALTEPNGAPAKALAADRSWIGAEAEVSPRVALERSVVGAGARVAGSGALRRCVIWPGAHVTAPLEDAVVTSAGTVVSCLDSAAG